MGYRSHKVRLSLAVAAVVSAASVVTAVSVGAGTAPSGERALGQSLIEPAYDDTTGALTYLLTPTHVANPVGSNPRAAAPLYLVVYPTSAAASVGALNCEDVPAENCPDHGPAIAGLAMSVDSAVYGGGVFGHDHLVGLANTHGDFNVAWTVWVVLFTSSTAANNHLTTLAAINQAVANGEAFIFPHPITTFHCSAVSASAYNRGAPVA